MLSFAWKKGKNSQSNSSQFLYYHLDTWLSRCLCLVSTSQKQARTSAFCFNPLPLPALQGTALAIFLSAQCSPPLLLISTWQPAPSYVLFVLFRWCRGERTDTADLWLVWSRPLQSLAFLLVDIWHFWLTPLLTGFYSTGECCYIRG